MHVCMSVGACICAHVYLHTLVWTYPTRGLWVWPEMCEEYAYWVHSWEVDHLNEPPTLPSEEENLNSTAHIIMDLSAHMCSLPTLGPSHLFLNTLPLLGQLSQSLSGTFGFGSTCTTWGYAMTFHTLSPVPHVQDTIIALPFPWQPSGCFKFEVVCVPN